MTNRKKQVLIVDDFGDTAKILVDMFDHLSVNTESVKNTEEALKQVDTKNYELVIADSHMPDGTGLSLLKRIRKNQPDTKVVLMSTFDSGNTQKLAVADSIDYYLAKPVKIEHLEKMLKDLALKK